MHRPATPRSPSRPAFTLIELLIVIGIITILISVAVVVGQKVTSSGKQRVTEGLIKTLDMSLSEYIHARGQIPPAYVPDPRDPAYAVPVADVHITNLVPPDPTDLPPFVNNTVGLYLIQCRAVPEADAVLRQIEPRYVRMYDPDKQTGATSVAQNKRPALLTVFDGWGRPIRYVHPAFTGIIPDMTDPAQLATTPLQKTSTITQIRRTGKVAQNAAVPPDADAGVPLNNRPYFYSMGADGKAGYEYEPNPPYKTVSDFNKDNVFTVVPKYVE
jgi:prepilin-type N-terminal cleavage/methylation domain-containing protein